MNIFDYAIQDSADIASGLSVDVHKGLDRKAVAGRLAEFRPNKLVLQEITGWHIFLRQFKSAFIYLLVAAMIITILLGQWVNTLMVFVFIAINAGLGFYQEYSSEKTAQLLSKYALPALKCCGMGTWSRSPPTGWFRAMWSCWKPVIKCRLISG